MPSATLNPDDRESQVLFLNYHDPPNTPNACSLSSTAIDPTLGMLGLTHGFIGSLTMAEKKAIIFLASYAVDWRECGQEYDDIVFCFGRAHRWEKSVASGLAELHCDTVKYAKHIQAKRIEPKIDQLRQSSYRLNRGISAVAPRGVAVSQAAEPPKTTAAAATISTKTPPSSEQTLPAPAMANGSDVKGATTTASNTPLYSGRALPSEGNSDFDSSSSSSTSGTSSFYGSPQDSASYSTSSEASADADMATPPGQPQGNPTSAVADGSMNQTSQQGSDVMDTESSQQASNSTANIGGSSDTQRDVEMRERTDQTAETGANTARGDAEVYNDTETNTERPNKRRRIV
ncbi:hypothetical protein GGR58DRAFT_527349 [Xylaria digitata]|nr:hypothetical protein GGR58DRAFT_527349 [Xylaria digitata]